MNGSGNKITARKSKKSVCLVIMSTIVYHLPCRAKKRVEKALPQTPQKRSALLRSLLATNPTSTDKVKCLNEQVMQNVNKFVNSAKKKRTDGARHAVALITASVSGENISQTNDNLNLSKKLGLTPRRISGGQRVRQSVLETDCFHLTKRKVRKDALSKADLKKIYDFWVSPGISRPTGNKADIKRFRTGPKQYVSQAIHILEKTQSEVYQDFKKSHP